MQPEPPQINLEDIGFDQLSARLPSPLSSYLDRPGDGPVLLATELPNHFSSQSVCPKPGQPKTLEQRLWQLVGLYYLNRARPFEAIPIFNALYEQMIRGQESLGYRVHKGMPLVHISDCYRALGYPALAKRYSMLTLCEDAILYKGSLDLNRSGASRLLSIFGLPNSELDRYSKQIHRLNEQHTAESFWPEWLLQHLEQDWMLEAPSGDEASIYVANAHYVSYLMSRLGDITGVTLELLASYLVSCIPGFRTYRRKRAATTEYDLVCSPAGLRPDFLSEIGRYFVCECKDRKDRVSFSDLAKFCRVLDSTKCNFGVIFSPRGISGAKNTRFAERERLKVYQDRGIAIIVIDISHLNAIASGGSFIHILRANYEQLRLDLMPPLEENSA